MNNTYRFIFMFFIAAILCAYAMFRPSWGFMDDRSGINNAHAVWSGQTTLQTLLETDTLYGRFRPLYHLWMIFAYSITSPLALYIFIFIAGMLTLLLWGRMMGRFFPSLKNDQFSYYIIPLLFFIFPPFWNIFMYISIQEKFIFFFGTLSLFYLLKSYEHARSSDMVMAIVILIFGILFKETGLALFVAYGMFAVADLLFFKINKKLSLFLLVVALVFGFSYLYIVKSIMGSYTDSYKSNLSIGLLCQALLHSSLIIKVIGLGSLVALIIGCLKKTASPLFIIIPSFVIAYIAMLLPWGFPNYLLAPLGPFLIVILVFYVMSLMNNPIFSRIIKITSVVLIGIVVCCDIIPRISKMADKKTIIENIKSLNTGSELFFYPPPFLETSCSLEGFASIKLRYIDTIQSFDLINSKNYLLLNDEAGPVVLKDIDIEREVYRNETWRVYLLQENKGVNKTVQFTGPQRLLTKIKNWVRHQ